MAGLRLEISSPWGALALSSPLLGRFNAYNLLGCLGVLLRNGIEPAAAIDALGRIAPAAGRMQRLGGDGRPLVVIDYAHTPDALEKALQTVGELLDDGGRLYCIFGCGGERDRGKRPLMGAIACRLADTVLITNDNPRSEEPRQIFADILDGLDVTGLSIADEAAAGKQAITVLKVIAAAPSR